MMSIFIGILVTVALAAVVATFFLGMIAFGQNGREAGAQSNRWMAWRVRTQAIAIGVLALAALWTAAHG